MDVQKIPPRFTSTVDESTNTESQAYKQWRTDYYNLTSWLFAFLDSFFQHPVIGCSFAHEIWSRIHTHFASRTKARVRQLQLQPKIITKEGSTTDYLLKIKKLVDYLAAVGAPLSESEHTNVIFDGLNEDYHRFITYVTAKDPAYSIPDLEALLIAQEDIVDRFKKPDQSMVQVHLTQAPTQEPRSSDSSILGKYGRGTNASYGRGFQENYGRGFQGHLGRGGRNMRGGRSP
ncbi:uncharacterized protein [Arachis hypogaea]|uniref:uncharacterized protein n=1 Tax=Arachis hypogaea TaxID=3818 RepID=UPI003B21DB77